MDPVTISALIGAGVSGGNMVSEGIQNRKNRKFAVKMYNQQRKDALDDWRLNNEYNAPKAVMARYAEAGLNPALMYTGGTANQADMVKSSPFQEPQQTAPKFNPEAITAAINAEMARVQQMNYEAQRQLTAAQTFKVLAETDKTKLDTSLLRDTYAELVKSVGLSNEETQGNIELKYSATQKNWQDIRESTVRMQKIIADTKFTLDENNRKELMSTLERGLVTEQTKLVVEKILSEQKQRILMQAQTEKNNSEKTRLEKQAAMIDAQIKIFNQTNAKDWTKIGNDILRTIIQAGK